MKKIQHEILVMGGLGNQLFLLAQAIRLKVLYPNDEVVLNHAEYFLGLRSDRPYYLDNLFRNLQFKKLHKVKAVFNYLLIRFFLKIAKRKLTIAGNSLKIFRREIHFGYFQHINTCFTDDEVLHLLRRSYAESISNASLNGVLAIHIRRGDYLHRQHNQHGLIRIDDLLEEVKAAFAFKAYGQILIFSDSPELIDISAFRQFGLPVSIDDGGDVICVFERMAQCDGLIASNSSFSLWAGLLGQPDFFSIPEMWMVNMSSYELGLPEVRRYKNKF